VVRATTLVAAAALALAACGTNNNAPSGSSSASANTAGIVCSNGSIKASGSTAQKNAISAWINNYQTKCSGATINYSASGSGAGVQDFINNQVSFAGSDSAISGSDLTSANSRCGSGGTAWNLPMVVGPIGIAYNLTGVSKLIVSPTVLAEIFSGKITTWNDPALTALNPGTTLPSAKIVTYHRSDSSGTTDNFTKYLAATAPSEWSYSHSKTWTAPGGLGAKGSDQVAASIKSTPNSIGYVEYSYIQNDSLPSAELDNGGGAVTLSAQSASVAAAQATVVGTGGDLTLKLNYSTTTAGAWPIILVTYEIACNNGNVPDPALVKDFLTYTSSSAGQSILDSVGSAPLPASILSQVQSSVSQLKS
jgi:phosphate transport system substrate-binding protein